LLFNPDAAADLLDQNGPVWLTLLPASAQPKAVSVFAEGDPPL
jgi:hypothetical protein